MLPRRKVPVGRLQPTGRMPGYNGEMIAYEGPLERDFIYLHKFDSLTVDIISQPFTIKYRNPSGRGAKPAWNFSWPVAVMAASVRPWKEPFIVRIS